MESPWRSGRHQNAPALALPSPPSRHYRGRRHAHGDHQILAQLRPHLVVAAGEGPRKGIPIPGVYSSQGGGKTVTIGRHSVLHPGQGGTDRLDPLIYLMELGHDRLVVRGVVVEAGDV